MTAGPVTTMTSSSCSSAVDKKTCSSSDTQSAAGQLLAADPALKNHPLLKARVELLFELNADAMN